MSPSAPIAPPSPPPSPAPDAPHGVYRVAPGTIDGLLAHGWAARLDDGQTGLLGRPRVLMRDGAFVRRAADAPAEPLEQVLAVPSRFGGGFVFATKKALFWSDSFLGELHPLRTEAVESLSLGPQGVVANVQERLRGIAVPSGTLTGVGVVGAMSVGQGPDGAFSASLWNGREVESRDGVAWTDVTPPDVRQRAMQAPAPAPVTAASAPSPEAAIATGVDAGGVAIVGFKEDIFGVDVASGAVVARVPNPMPAYFWCDGVRHGDDVLLVCANPKAAGMLYPPYVVRVPASLAGPPVVEHVFALGAPVTANDAGDLAYAGSCSGDPASPAVCVRTASGQWVERAVDPALARRGLRWVPLGGEGDAVGLLHDGLGRVSARTGVVTTWTTPVPVKPVSVLIIAGLDHMWTVTAAGTLRGWSQDAGNRFTGAVEIGAGGEATTSATGYDALTAQGAWAIAEKAGAVLQSVDHGRTWTAVDPPPSSFTFSADRCSSVGCIVDGWMRVGWSVGQAPVAAAAQPRLIREPAPLPALTRPTLVCKSSGPRAVRAVRSATADTSTAARFAGYPNMWGSTLPSPSAEATPLVWWSGKELAWIAPFDPGGSISRIPAPATGPFVTYNEYGVIGSAFRVTPAPGLRFEGIAYEGDGGMLVLRAGTRTPARVERAASASLLSVVANPPHYAWLDQVCEPGPNQRGITSTVMQDGKPVFDVWGDLGPYTTIGGLPTTMDALAVGPGGELAILRVPGEGDAPDEVSPALLLRAGNVITALAPWSSLATGKDCAAEPAWRVTVQTSAPWVDLAADGLSLDSDAPTVARVRWGATGVCLEALELHARPREIAGLDVTVVARFDGPPRAGAFAIGPDRAMRQGMECGLGLRAR